MNRLWRLAVSECLSRITCTCDHSGLDAAVIMPGTAVETRLRAQQAVLQ